MPVYFDQMVDDVFLNGKAGDTVVNTDTAKPAAEPQKIAALPPVSVPRVPKETVKAPTATFTHVHGFGWHGVLSIADPTQGVPWRMGDTGDFREAKTRRWI